MLRAILLISISIISFKSHANVYFVKYNDSIKLAQVIESYINKSDYLNRLQELKYLDTTVEVLDQGLIYGKTSQKDDLIINSYKSGGEGAGS